MDRRSFLQSSAAAGATLSTVKAVSADPEKKPRVGLIGCGWYGKCDLLRLIQVADVEVVSLCDVDKQMLAEAAKIVSTRQNSKREPRQFTDFREMLKPKDLDIVLIATPDHWHALPMIEAVKAGADVYVQKPIGVDIEEGKAMVAAARKYNRVVQVGTQRRSTPHLIEARDEVINKGRLGKIGLVEVYCYYHMRANRQPPTIDPPPHLDYEMWAGPAPKLPYNELIHPRSWRAFMEYSNGIVGDMCIHMLDMVRWMLELGWPQTVSSSGGIVVQKDSIATTSDTQTATFDFDDLTVVWQHRTWGDAVDPKYPWGATIYGDRGTLKLSVNSYDFVTRPAEKSLHGDVVYELEKYPEDKTEKDLERHVAPAIRGHMVDFLNAIKTRGKPVADIEQGHISTTSCILANLSAQLGRSLAWDAANQRVIDDEEANALLARPYRAPWVHPAADQV